MALSSKYTVFFEKCPVSMFLPECPFYQAYICIDLHCNEFVLKSLGWACFVLGCLLKLIFFIVLSVVVTKGMVLVSHSWNSSELLFKQKAVSDSIYILRTGREIPFSPVFWLQSSGLERKLNLRKLSNSVLLLLAVCNKILRCVWQKEPLYAQFTLLFSDLPAQERWSFLLACLYRFLLQTFHIK